MKMVKIPNKNYSIGDTTVTQGQWKQIMGTEPWKGQSYVMEGDDYPAVYVSWYDAVEFCKKLSDIEGKAYRLPTEAEWEYACRAGATTAYYFSDNATELDKYAWFDENAWCAGEKYAHRVAQKSPNQFGLYDMHGNVWEWCDDLYGEGPEYRMLRGGSWSVNSDGCSAWYRNCNTPELRNFNFGFRLASTLT
jgi:formylglycine-generating enzyme required for sulfatase activity